MIRRSPAANSAASTKNSTIKGQSQKKIKTTAQPPSPSPSGGLPFPSPFLNEDDAFFWLFRGLNECEEAQKNLAAWVRRALSPRRVAGPPLIRFQIRDGILLKEGRDDAARPIIQTEYA